MRTKVHPRDPSAARTSIRIAALGDSTTAGTPGFKSPLEAPPKGEGNEESQYGYWLMRIHPEWQVLNRGVNRERIEQIRARFARDVVDEGAEVVIVIAGVNDIYRGAAAEYVQRELEALYQLAHDAQPPVGLVAGTILPFDTATPAQNADMHAVNAWIARYAAERPGVTYCDARAAVAQPGHPDRLVASPDGLHPTPHGYRLMALALEPSVRSALAQRNPMR
jgi:lysophospholipase L1-like esterase